MAVQPGPTFKRYAANGVASVYTIPFLLIDAADLQITLNGIEVTSGFTLTGIGNPASECIFSVPPMGDLLFLQEMTYERLTDYQINGDFLSVTVNRDYDRLWLAMKQSSRDVGRSLKLSSLEPEGIASLPSKSERAGMLLGFDDSGNPVATFSAEGSGTQLAIDLAISSDPRKGTGMLGFAGATAALEFYRARSLQYGGKVSLSAHRGLSRVAPENTIASFEMAARAGFQGLETDAQLTSDGHWVVIHDSRVDRTTNGTGSVMNMTLSQLRELDAGSWFDPYYSSEKIPTLDEFLRVCRVYGCTPHVELKDIERSYTDAEISSLAAICKAAFPELNFVLYCFSNTLISRLRGLHRDIKLSYLVVVNSSRTRF